MQKNITRGMRQEHQHDFWVPDWFWDWFLKKCAFWLKYKTRDGPNFEYDLILFYLFKVDFHFLSKMILFIWATFSWYWTWPGIRLTIWPVGCCVLMLSSPFLCTAIPSHPLSFPSHPAFRLPSIRVFFSESILHHGQRSLVGYSP